VSGALPAQYLPDFPCCTRDGGVEAREGDIAVSARYSDGLPGARVVGTSRVDMFGEAKAQPAKPSISIGQLRGLNREVGGESPNPTGMSLPTREMPTRGKPVPMRGTRMPGRASSVSGIKDRENGPSPAPFHVDVRLPADSPEPSSRRAAPAPAAPVVAAPPSRPRPQQVAVTLSAAEQRLAEEFGRPLGYTKEQSLYAYAKNKLMK
jgi:hypothetical protein